jgi:hypothetical protein
MNLAVMERIELRTNDPSKVVRLSRVERFRDGSGYCCDLTVVSGGVSCTSAKFYFDHKALTVAVSALDAMASGIPGKCILKGEWEDDFVVIESNDMGHVRVGGEIQEQSEFMQCLQFAFRTDQTVLSPLARDLKVLQDA